MPPADHGGGRHTRCCRTLRAHWRGGTNAGTNLGVGGLLFSGMNSMDVQKDRGWLGRLWQRCIRHPWMVTGLGLAIMLGAVVEVTGPLLAKRALDGATAGHTAIIAAMAGALALLAVGRAVASFGR